MIRRLGSGTVDKRRCMGMRISLNINGPFSGLIREFRSRTVGGRRCLGLGGGDERRKRRGRESWRREEAAAATVEARFGGRRRGKGDFGTLFDSGGCRFGWKTISSLRDSSTTRFSFGDSLSDFCGFWGIMGENDESGGKNPLQFQVR
ncbi:hypothetical protein Droror1_Dr00016323 [Drosera rotundifolia]